MVWCIALRLLPYYIVIKLFYKDNGLNRHTCIDTVSGFDEQDFLNVGAISAIQCHAFLAVFGSFFVHMNRKRSTHYFDVYEDNFYQI